MDFYVITLFPEAIADYARTSVLGRAQKLGVLNVHVLPLRDFTQDKHHTTDDRVYGGGVGMLLKPEPIARALQSIYGIKGKHPKSKKVRSILLTPRGKVFTQKDARRLATYDELIFVSGRYEGVDARVESLVDERISIGEYVLSGGELGALVIIESVARLIPGVLGKGESAQSESHTNAGETEEPQYTRPEIFKAPNGKNMRVPNVLLSGNHQKISDWRKSKRKYHK